MTALQRQTARILFEASQHHLQRTAFGTSFKRHTSSVTSTNSWTCATCRGRSSTSRRQFSRKEWMRQLSASSRQQDDKPVDQPEAASPTATTPRSAPTSASNPSSLPSDTDRQRWDVSKRMSRLMDELLARASIAGQHINIYTGTDYSGIESLRAEILSQEQTVRDCHSIADNAKKSHHEAYAEQTSAQREIVGLLERKSSWSPTDLERYMNLVRSEHTNDQAVQVAKDNLAAAEKRLEDARSLLERLERKQYHEEQIWSDTIRRNSTWVTFGLMGVNILLLLAQIAIFEPYRRKKIVNDVKSALDQKTLSIPESAQGAQSTDDAGFNQEMVEKFAALRNVAEKAETVSDEKLADLLRSAIQQFEAEEDSAQPLDALAPLDVSSNDETAPASPKAVAPNLSERLGASKTWNDTVEAYKASFADMFSDRIIQVRRLDVTNAALQGAAVGTLIAGLIAALLRPR